MSFLKKEPRRRKGWDIKDKIEYANRRVGGWPKRCPECIRMMITSHVYNKGQENQTCLDCYPDGRRLILPEWFAHYYESSKGKMCCACWHDRKNPKCHAMAAERKAVTGDEHVSGFIS